MTAFLRKHLAVIGLVTMGVLAAAAGAFAAVAISTGSQQAPTKTVTVNVSSEPGATGPPGPAGPAGPKGDPGTPGAESCRVGTTYGSVIINSPGGHVEFETCIVD